MIEQTCRAIDQLAGMISRPDLWNFSREDLEAIKVAHQALTKAMETHVQREVEPYRVKQDKRPRYLHKDLRP